MKMESTLKLLSGSDIINQKLNGPKELPSSGWKEYCPSGSWIEKKQIQTCLEDTCSTIGVERIEKQNNLAQAEWIHDCKKAKVLKKVGKHWEVVGHHQGNEDWLLPEEALYLVEINVLELYHGGVPVSVEHAYALLLSESHNCTLQEYRVYSFLSRRGYKLIRHAEDVTVTRYEKQIHLDQILETQKRGIPAVSGEAEASPPFIVEKNPEVEVNVPSVLNTSAASTEKSSKTCEENDNQSTIITEEVPKQSTKRPISDSEDVCIIEDNIEVIDIEDSSLKKCLNRSFDDISVKQSKIPKQEKNKTAECLIIIDDDEEHEIEDDEMEVKQEFESDSSDELSDDDVVLVKSVRLESRHWYKPLRKSLVPTELIIVDLCEDVEVKVEKGPNTDETLQMISRKSRNEILEEMTNAKSGVSFIKSPNAYFLPKEIVPKHAQYRVNLNTRQEPNFQQSGPLCNQGRRHQQQFYNSNFSNNHANNAFLGDNVFMQACEMRAMAFSMIKAASSLMSAMSTQAPVNNTPSLINDLQVSPFYNVPQFSNPCYTPRMFNNNIYNNNLFHNNMSGNPRNSFMARSGGFSYGRRGNNRYRGYRNNNNRAYSPQQRQVSRYYGKVNTSSNIHEVVMIESDDDSVSEQRPKRGGNHIELPSKRSRTTKDIEIIDLCDDKVVKSEPIESGRKAQQTQTCIDKTRQVNVSEKDDKKSVFNLECKQEILDVGTEERLSAEEIIAPKKEVDTIGNLDDTEVKTEKLNELVEELNSETEVADSCKIEESHKELELTYKADSESPTSNLDITSTESLRIIEESNDSEVANIVQTSVSENKLGISELDIEGVQGPTSWQQYKEQTDQTDISPEEDTRRVAEVTPLTQPDQVKDIAVLLKSLQIFQTLDVIADVDKLRKFKISFDAYLPTDHFKKTLKMLPKFRIVVVKSTDSLPSKIEVDILKSSYQDGIPFVYAIVYDDTIAFYYYDTVSLTEYYED